MSGSIRELQDNIDELKRIIHTKYHGVSSNDTIELWWTIKELEDEIKSKEYVENNIIQAGIRSIINYANRYN